MSQIVFTIQRAVQAVAAEFARIGIHFGSISMCWAKAYLRPVTFINTNNSLGS